MKKLLMMLMVVQSLHPEVISQSVGIGTTNPSEKLQVAGNIKGDTIKPNAIQLISNAGSGKILTSDDAGNASWKTSSTSNAGGNIGYGGWGDCATNANLADYNPVGDSTGAAGDGFGRAVAISGSWAITGSPIRKVGANTQQGQVSFFKYESNGWVQKQIITDANGAAGDWFGISVSISGNYAIIGTPYDDLGLPTSNRGSASIYQFNGTSWVFMQKVVDISGGVDDNFGGSVSVSGNYAVVGALNDNVGANVDQGSASIYRYNGTSWVFLQKITDIFGTTSDFFGCSVSISGTWVIVGAYGDDEVFQNQGSAHTFSFDGATWSQTQRITSATAAVDEWFGFSVCISGNNAIIGSPHVDVGTNGNQGSVNFYQKGTTWVFMQKFTETGGGVSDNFGWSVAISGNYAIAGALFDDVGSNTDQGSSTIYLRIGPFWQKLQYVTDPAGEGSDLYGGSVSIDGNTKRFLIGAQSAGTVGKAVFGK
ncbi:MAG: FG-GAP repeat protein [Ferruginibacter sp.]